MVFAILIILWLAIFLFLACYLGRTPKGRGWLKIIWHSRKVRKYAAIATATVIAIAAVYITHPSAYYAKIDSRSIFEGYAQALILGLQEQGALSIDTACDLQSPQPELAYMLPAILSVYNEVVEKPTLPRLLQMNNRIVISFDGYKQFKNRSIRITKGVQKKLGPRYPVKMESFGSNHTITVFYTGNLWDNEQLCGLPTMEASIRENVEPALLMSIIRHISDFDFNYQSGRNARGLLALDSGIGLEQVFIGAHKLRRSLDSSQTTEDATATFYPLHDLKSMNSEWRKSPLKSSWVKEVLADVQFYRNNGLK
ncbi:MAG: hypothetical protein MJY82_03870 [Fibrobacter sp.]|nr:hypothetical protein [Fibrobacter sp.]